MKSVSQCHFSIPAENRPTDCSEKMRYAQLSIFTNNHQEYEQTTKTEMELPMILVETVNKIYQFFGFDGVIDEYTAFREPRLSRQNHENCDTCFPLIQLGGSTAIVSAELLFPEYKGFRINVDVKKVQEELPSLSSSWSLPIKSCTASLTGLCCLLDHVQVFRNVIERHLLCQRNQHESTGKRKNVLITQDSMHPNENECMDLTKLRACLAFKSLCNVYRHLGYNVLTEDNKEIISENARRLHVCSKSLCTDRNPGFLTIQCGPVLDISTGVKAVGIDAKDYYRIKETAFQEMAQERCNSQDSNDQAISLSEAEVTAELLSVKLHEPVSICAASDSHAAGVSRGASFILYNHCRISTIRKKFEQQVESGIYPELPEVKDIDFSLLTQDEEWELILLVLQFPSWLLTSASSKGRISLHPVLIGMDKLSRTLSVYYRRVRILTEHRTHLLPVMYARLYLLLCVEKVLGAGLSVFCMKALDYM